MQLFKSSLITIFITIFPMLGYAQTTEFEQYTLGSGDVVNISVFGQEDLSFQTRLSNVGVIRYPFLGDIKLTGKTVDEIERLIDEGLRGDYLVDPSVSVTVLEYRPFFIDGEVQQPGGYPFQPGLSLDKAVALAGGYTERANKNLMSIRRQIDGEETVTELGAKSMVFPGDIITVNSRFF